MSVFSKIFIVINLALVLMLTAVMGTLLSQKADYKAKYTASHKQWVETRKTLERSKKREEDNIQVLQKRNADLAEKVGQVNTMLANETKKRTDKQERLSSQRKAKAELHTWLKKSDKVQNDLDQHVTLKVKQLNDARVSRQRAIDERKRAFNGRQAQRDLVKATQDTIADIQRRSTELKKELKSLSELIARAKKEEDIPVERYAAELRQRPLIKGEVARVSPGVFLCVLDVGTNDGVKEGTIFTVYRGGQYIGKVKVRKIFRNQASAQFMLDQMFPGRKIQKGDKVTTRFN